MKVIGYIRVSTDEQDLEKQKHLLLEYAQNKQLLINEFISVEVSSKESAKERRIDELFSILNKGDVLLVAELGRLGRNMLETLNIINEISKNGINIIFIRQPELSTVGPHAKLLLAIYSYFAEAEREYISMRTKQGLAAVKAKGKSLGRPKGSRNRDQLLEPYKEQIKNYLRMGLNLASIIRVINNQREESISYNAFKYFVQHNEDLLKLWMVNKQGSFR